ncbi:unnamed protein product [Caenorhabditis angaria]|uniref:Uncharacterized protein n=1 Tax=Caenorhabditis angaria TaxID=860376 RepID=A0A9P1MZV6_9PELO|nr:unnamed protein product [Caenorhabditis angaria]
MSPATSSIVVRGEKKREKDVEGRISTFFGNSYSYSNRLQQFVWLAHILRIFFEKYSTPQFASKTSGISIFGDKANWLPFQSYKL